MTGRRSATVRVVHETRPKRPAVDSGEAFETHLRSMFKDSVETWCKANNEPDKQPDKETTGQIVDDLVAHWASAFETTLESATASFLSTFELDDDDEGTTDIACPQCDHEFELPEKHADGSEVSDDDKEQEVVCPKCKAEFGVELLDEDGDDDDDEPDDPNDGERKAG